MKLTTKTRIAAVVMTLSLVAAVPAMSFAKDKDHGEGNGHGNAFGHFKNNTTANVTSPGNSWFGHLMAWFHQNENGQNQNTGHNDGDDDNDEGSSTSPTPTPTALPVISNVRATSTYPTAALLGWDTNVRTSSKIWVSTTSPVDTSGTPTVTRYDFLFNHQVWLNGLTSGTTYHAVIQATDVNGNNATSSDVVFTTPVGVVTSPTPTPTPTPTTTPIVGPIISNAIATVGSTSVQVNWTTNEAADSEIYFGTSSPVVIGGATTTAIINPALVTSHAVTVSGLSTSTTYYMIIQSKDAASSTQATSQFSFTTGM